MNPLWLFFAVVATALAAPPLPPGIISVGTNQATPPLAPALPAIINPALAMRLVTESNLTLSPFGWSSVTVTVDMVKRAVSVPASGGHLLASAVCSNVPVLAVTINSATGAVVELERSTNLVTWERSNVRWVSDGMPIRYYVAAPEVGEFYRLRKP
jgi:hypothetical protein